MFTYEKCSIEDFALWIDSIMENCLKVSVYVYSAETRKGYLCDLKVTSGIVAAELWNA